jgi:hypothetical protein
MFPIALTAELDALLSALRSAVDAAIGVELHSASPAQLTTLLAGLNVEVNRLAGADRRVIAELDTRGSFAELGTSSTADLVAQRLLVNRGEARARVAAARSFGPRRALTGEPLEPVLPLVAQALDDGSVSPAHARVIAKLMDGLPGEVEAEHGVAVQEFLLEKARSLDPHTLDQLAVRLRDTLDPDGPEDRIREQNRKRDFRLISHPDGSSTPAGYLTPALTTALKTVLDPLAAPRPATIDQPSGTAGVDPLRPGSRARAVERDTRTPGQRMHDALADAVMHVLRVGDLPASGGTPTTITVSITLDQLISRTGYATNAFGDLLPIPELLRLAEEAELIPVVFDKLGGVLAHGRTRRFATPALRKALFARDGGCIFPGCTRPASWTEAHHVIPWAQGGATDLDNLCLACDYDHDTHEQRGWKITMINGVPWCIPPAWLDPDQRPRRNQAHHRIAINLPAELCTPDTGFRFTAETRADVADPCADVADPSVAAAYTRPTHG